ncbi:hypothetical protein [Salinithrix halophila]|uniref:TM2 domain-containing protein n=1 Tax=Salinithrix halophila TaxID=1485204 RepID=A0ABV8JEE7_9BACL
MKQSKAATFILSFIPGLGHFHLGLMNRGLQLMIVFFGAAFLFNLIDFSFPFALPIIWFFGLFDALQHYDRIRDTGVVDDQPFFAWSLSTTRSSGGKWVGWVLIITGVFLLVDHFLPEFIRTALFAILLIGVGIRIIAGKSVLPSSRERKDDGS